MGSQKKSKGEVEPYGYELILDIQEVESGKFQRFYLKLYFEALCQAIKMERCKLVFWDDRWTTIFNKILPWRWFWPVEVQTDPKTIGISAVQFILTSSVVVHALTKRNAIYVNIFSCKSFNPEVAKTLTKSWFDTESCTSHFIKRM